MILRAALVALLVTGGGLAYTLWRLNIIRADLAVATARINGYEQHQKYLARLRDLNDDWAVIVEEVGTSDEALSDYLSRAAGRLWP